MNKQEKKDLISVIIPSVVAAFFDCIIYSKFVFESFSI